MVGSGAREHALAWRLARSPNLTELHAAPGNPGIAALGQCHPVRADDADGLLALALTLDADLVVIGPEGPLVAGIGDELRRNGITVFGPGAEAARIEGSKAFAKDVMRRRRRAHRGDAGGRAPAVVVKADGLAAGKGVFCCRDSGGAGRGAAGGAAVPRRRRSRGAARRTRSLRCSRSRTVRRAVPLGTRRTSKRIGDSDTGPEHRRRPGLSLAAPWFGDRRRASLAASTSRSSTSSPSTALRRRAVLRRADGPRRPPEGAVEFDAALQRPGDAGAAAAGGAGFLATLAAAAPAIWRCRPALSGDAAVAAVLVAAPGLPRA